MSTRLNLVAWAPFNCVDIVLCLLVSSNEGWALGFHNQGVRFATFIYQLVSSPPQNLVTFKVLCYIGAGFMACAGLSGRGYVLISVSVVADSGLWFALQHLQALPSNYKAYHKHHSTEQDILLRKRWTFKEFAGAGCCL